jgi:uncharacterized protein YdeI (YjbR/CyaY-like superfamily)
VEYKIEGEDFRSAEISFVQSKIKIPMNKPSSRLKRALNPMPNDVLETLEKEKLVDSYYTRPPYQRNDYISWISRAKRNDTREKRLLQMIN